jgi:Holliday junction DNA helicase RuvB
LEQIIHRAARIIRVSLDPEGAKELSSRARGTPRVANRLLKRVRDYAQVRADGVVTREVAAAALELLEIDHLGLDEVDRKILLTVTEKFGGGPVGLETVATAVGEEPETVEDVYEPYLMQIGFLQRTQRGRVVTQAAYRHLSLPVPEGRGLFD